MLKKMLFVGSAVMLIGAGCQGPITPQEANARFLECQRLSGSETRSAYPRRCFDSGGDIKAEVGLGNYYEKLDFIHLTGNFPVEPVKESVTVTGEARTWYFEASFPVTVETESGVVLGTGIAQAQGDWMTDQFVPFEVTVEFPPQPAFTRGYLVFHKDNPSGLPEHDDSMRVPITFGN